MDIAPITRVSISSVAATIFDYLLSVSVCSRETLRKWS